MGIPVDAKIYVAGHDSLIGAVLCRKLQALGYQHIITRGPEELDLRSQLAVHTFFEQELPDYVFIATLTCEHVIDNLLRPAESFYGNLMALSNIIHASYLYEVRKLLSIIDSQFGLEALKYETDDFTLQRYREESREADDLLRSVVAGLCDRYRQQYDCDFISVAFHREGAGPAGASIGDPFALNPRWAGAPTVLDQGADPRHREHFYSDDPADACLFLMENFSAVGPITVRTGLRGPG